MAAAQVAMKNHLPRIPSKVRDYRRVQLLIVLSVFLFLYIHVNLTPGSCGPVSKPLQFAPRGRSRQKVSQKGHIKYKDMRTRVSTHGDIDRGRRKRKGAGGQEVIGLLWSTPEMTFL